MGFLSTTSRSVEYQRIPDDNDVLDKERHDGPTVQDIEMEEGMELGREEPRIARPLGGGRVHSTAWLGKLESSPPNAFR